MSIRWRAIVGRAVVAGRQDRPVKPQYPFRPASEGGFFLIGKPARHEIHGEIPLEVSPPSSTLPETRHSYRKTVRFFSGASPDYFLD